MPFDETLVAWDDDFESQVEWDEPKARYSPETVAAVQRLAGQSRVEPPVSFAQAVSERAPGMQAAEMARQFPEYTSDPGELFQSVFGPHASRWWGDQTQESLESVGEYLKSDSTGAKAIKAMFPEASRLVQTEQFPQIAGGLVTTATGLGEFATSPAGFYTAAASAVPGGGRLVSALFLADTLRNAPEAGTELGKAVEEGDWRKATEIIAGTTGVGALTGVGTFRRGKKGFRTEAREAIEGGPMVKPPPLREALIEQQQLQDISRFREVPVAGQAPVVSMPGRGPAINVVAPEAFPVREPRGGIPATGELLEQLLEPQERTSPALQRIYEQRVEEPGTLLLPQEYYTASPDVRFSPVKSAVNLPAMPSAARPRIESGPFSVSAPSGLELQPAGVSPVARGGIPANVGMLEILPPPGMEFPAINELLRQRVEGGPVLRGVEQAGQVIRREGEFPAARAEATAEQVRTQVGEGVAAEVHPEKPLTENQIKITVESIRREIEQGRFPEAETGGIGQGIRAALEKNKESGSINLGVLKDVVEFGRTVFKTGMEFAQWAREMTVQLGKDVLRYLGDAWNKMKEPYALQKQEAGTVYGDVPKQPAGREQAVSAEESAAGVPSGVTGEETAGRREIQIAPVKELEPVEFAGQKIRWFLVEKEFLNPADGGIYRPGDKISEGQLRRGGFDIEGESIRAPDPDWQVTVQSDQGVPGTGYVQIDKIAEGQNIWSRSPETLGKEGYVIPDLSQLPQGRYSMRDALKKASSSWADRLEGLKIKGQGVVGANPFPEIARSVWNTGIDVMQAAIRAGKTLAQAIDDFVKHLKDSKTTFDETKVRAYWTEQSRTDRPMQMAGEPAAVPPTTPGTQVSGEVSTVKVSPTMAKQMEARVKLPVEEKVGKVTEQFNLFLAEIGDALTSGGQFLPKELRPDVAKGAPAEPATVTNKRINQYFVNKLVTLTRDLKRAEIEAGSQADPIYQSQLKLVRERAQQAFRQIQELRRTSHEALYFWNKIKGEYQEIASILGNMPEVKQWVPYLDRIWKEVRDRNFGEAGKAFLDFLRVNLFTIGSWTLDFFTNGLAVASEIPGWAAMDLAHLATGKSPDRFRSVLRALSPAIQSAVTLGKRGRLPENIEIGLGTVVGGERMGLSREIMVNFSEILRSRPELAAKLKNIDLILAAPVRMKRATDNFFGRFGATAELFNEAYQQGRSKGLKGDELNQFVNDFVARPPEAAVATAVEAGKKIKFNRDLSNWEEAFSNNLVTKAVVETFPRWTFQFTRWAGEMIGLNPRLWKSVLKGEAKPQEIVSYLSKTATGLGAIYAFNQLFYDNIDANTMEYVAENGDRIRLSGRTPAPELFFVNALLRRDWPKAKAALQYVSFPGAKLISGQPAGLISPLVDAMRQSIGGSYTAERFASELTQMVNNMIPGKSMLGFVRSFFDPTIREGIGSPIPGVAELLPQKVNPTTGEPLAPYQQVTGTPLTLPTVGGTPIPGAKRVLNEIEKTLLNHGIGLTRPRRTSLIDVPMQDVPKALRREYEQSAGRWVGTILGNLIQSEDFQSLPFDIRREVLLEAMSNARTVARAELDQKYGIGTRPEQAAPLNIQRLPEKLRR